MAFRTTEIAIAEARSQDPVMDAIITKSEQAKAVVVPALSYLDQLGTEIDTMPIAERYLREKWPDLSALAGIAAPRVRGLSEAEYKRETMRIELERIRNELIGISGAIGDLVLQVEAAKTE
ncbi:MAG: hypothetical protein HYV38_03700 [Candidatus Levybacteria bacterium]|nr:hypothetical protein [Candidatus Levybacteria bacterium]